MIIESLEGIQSRLSEVSGDSHPINGTIDCIINAIKAKNTRLLWDITRLFSSRIKNLPTKGQVTQEVSLYPAYWGEVGKIVGTLHIAESFLIDTYCPVVRDVKDILIEMERYTNSYQLDKYYNTIKLLFCETYASYEV